MIQAKKWATLRIIKGADSGNLPVRKTSDVIKELKKEGYIVKSYINDL